MKSRSYRVVLLVIAGSMLYQNSLFTINFGSIAKGVEKGVEIAGHAATGVDAAMNIASVGVSLWGSDADRARMAKGMQITGLITSIAKGDFETAQAHAEGIRGARQSSQYTPLTANELLADADIVPAQSIPPSTGPSDTMPYADFENLKKNEKIVTINDTKVAQFGILNNQLVFAARLPQQPHEQKLYELMNGWTILLRAMQDSQDASKINIICYRVISKGASKPVERIEFNTVSVPKQEISKDLFIGTTNNELSVFCTEGSDIVKKTLIPSMG